MGTKVKANIVDQRLKDLGTSMHEAGVSSTTGGILTYDGKGNPIVLEYDVRVRQVQD